MYIIMKLYDMISTHCGDWDIEILCWAFYTIIYILNLILHFVGLLKELINNLF
jgi:hypothetical protein